jgi:hypothetical protein
MILRLDGAKLKDAASVLAALGDAFGFKAKNRDALVDILTHLDDPTRGSHRMSVFPGEIVLLAISGDPPQSATISELAAFVNWRRLEKGQPPLLAIATEP